MAGFLLKADGFKLLKADATALLKHDPLVRLFASTHISAGGTTATTAQLTAPAGKTSGANFQAGQISDDTNPLPTLDLATDKYAEFEFSITTTDEPAVSDVIELRITRNGVPLDTYTVTPTITIVAAAGQAVPVKMANYRRRRVA